MSASSVHPEHINVLIWAGLLRKHPNGALHWTYSNPSRVGVLSTETATATGQMLLDAVATSLNHAYPDRPDPFTADTYTYRRPLHTSWTTPELLSALHGYRYQAVEARDWAASEAAAFVDALENRLIRSIPGYSSGPWCIGPESTPAAAKARAGA